MQMGFENKRQAYLLGGLVSVVLIAGIYELKDSFGSPSPHPSAPLASAQPVAGKEKPSAVTEANGPEAQKITTDTLDPVLHVERLEASEKVLYEGSGRNLFSAEPVAAPVHIEAPVKSARLAKAAAPVAPVAPQAPRPPAIDMKFFGYAKAKDNSYKAFLIHGDEIFAARSGEVINHRYKIGAITPSNVQVTDLGYNNTQTLPLQAN